MNETEKTLHDESTPEVTVTTEQPRPTTTAHEESVREQYQRLSADFVNFKKRVEKERSDWMLSAQCGILEKLLPIFDELDRALGLAAEQNQDNNQAWLSGLLLIQKNWQKVLTDMGVQEIATSGKFDPTLHEALMQEAAGDRPADEIAKTLSKGYRFKDRVVRHAKVSVTK